MDEEHMPPLAGGEWLLDYLFEIGPVTSTGMGLAGVSWQELHAWQALTGTLLAPWEARALHALSGHYASALGIAQEPDAPAPWRSLAVQEAEQKQRDRAQAGLTAAFGALAQR